MKDILGKNQKIADIEALRGIGLLLVVSYPFFERFLQLFIPGHEPSHFLGMDQWGLARVAIFLLISGYFMVPAYSIDSMPYLKKRIGRLFPLYFISICIIFRMKWLIGLGTISYLVYLIHQNIWFRNTTFLYR